MSTGPTGRSLLRGLKELAPWLKRHREALRRLLLQLASSGDLKAQLGAARLTASAMKDEALPWREPRDRWL